MQPNFNLNRGLGGGDLLVVEKLTPRYGARGASKAMHRRLTKPVAGALRRGDVVIAEPPSALRSYVVCKRRAAAVLVGVAGA